MILQSARFNRLKNILTGKKKKNMLSKIKTIVNNSYCEEQYNKPAVQHFLNNNTYYHKYIIQKKQITFS